MVRHFKNLAANAARFLKCVYFTTLSSKGLTSQSRETLRYYTLKENSNTFLTNFTNKELRSIEIIFRNIVLSGCIKPNCIFFYTQFKVAGKNSESSN